MKTFDDAFVLVVALVVVFVLFSGSSHPRLS